MEPTRQRVSCHHVAVARGSFGAVRRTKTDMEFAVKLAALLLLVTVVARLETSARSPTPNGSCPVSRVTRDSPPPDPNADSGGPAEDWYINTDRTIWVGPVQ